MDWCCLNIFKNQHTTQTCCPSPNMGVGMYIESPNGVQVKYPIFGQRSIFVFRKISQWAFAWSHDSCCVFCKTTATQTCFVDQRWGGVLILKTIRLLNLNTCCMVYEDRWYIQKMLTWCSIKFNICWACWLLGNIVNIFECWSTYSKCIEPFEHRLNLFYYDSILNRFNHFGNMHDRSILPIQGQYGDQRIQQLLNICDFLNINICELVLNVVEEHQTLTCLDNTHFWPFKKFDYVWTCLNNGQHFIWICMILFDKALQHIWAPSTNTYIQTCSNNVQHIKETHILNMLKHDDIQTCLGYIQTFKMC